MGPVVIEKVLMWPAVIEIDEVGRKETMKLVMKLSRTKQEGVV
jgi:hypothetical protein